MQPDDIISKHNSPSQINYLLRPQSFELSTDRGYVQLVNPMVLKAQTWYHLAATYNGDSLKYYVNGCLTAKKKWSGALETNDLSACLGNAEQLQSEQLYGTIDEIRIWKVARTQEQISASIDSLPNPTSQTGLLALYDFKGNLTNLQGDARWNGTAEGDIFFGPGSGILFKKPNITFTTTASSTCMPKPGSGRIEVRAQPSGQYSIDNRSYSQSGIFPNLLSGTYTVFVRPTASCQSFSFPVQVDQLQPAPQRQVIFRCTGEQVVIGTHTYTSNGFYIDSLLTRRGCDSIVQSSIAFLDKDTVDINASICGGTSYALGNGTYSSTGHYQATFKNRGGCDSLVRVALSVNPAWNITTKTTICAGDTAREGASFYTQPGRYTNLYKTAQFGCDSTRITELSIRQLSPFLSPEIAVDYLTPFALHAFISDANTTFTWLPDTLLKCTTCTTQTLALSTSHGFVGRLTDNLLGCSRMDTCFVKVSCPFKLANIITANGDGRNDSLYIEPFPCLKRISRLSIYNRWGQQVLERTDFAPGSIPWPASMQKALYYYSVTYLDDADRSMQRKGWLEVTD